MGAIQVKADSFKREVLEADKTVLIDFWASWCGPCKMMLPIVEELAEERKDIKVCKVNVDEEPELAIKYNVMSIPTFMVVKNGEVTTRKVGGQSKDALIEMI